MSTEAADREAIRGLAIGYARGVDRRRFAAVGDLFSPDGELLPPGAQRRGPAEIAAALEGLRRYEMTYHLLGQHHITIGGEPGDGGPDDATGEVYCVAHHALTVDGQRRDRIMYIRYQDRYRRTDAGWRFARRALEVDWTEDHPLQT